MHHVRLRAILCLVAMRLAVLASPAADLPLRWTTQLGSPCSTSPALLPTGGVLLGCQGTPDPTSNALPNRNGGLRALRPDGTLAWRRDLFGGVAATPLVAPDGTIYVGSIGTWTDGGRLYRLRDGTIEWSRNHERQFLNPGALGHGDRIYFLHAMGGIVARQTNGAPAWERSYVGQISWLGEPAVLADGTLVLGIGRGVGQLVALNPLGEELWSADAYGIVGPPQVGADGTIYVAGGPPTNPTGPGSLSPTGASTGLRAYNPDGSFQWAVATPGLIASAPVVSSEGTVLAGDASGMLTAWHRSGEVAWSQSTGSPIVASPALAADGTVFAVTLDGRLVAFASDGSPAGSRALGGELRNAPLILPDGTVIVAGSDGQVYAVQGTSGPAAGPAFAQRDPRRSGRDDSTDLPSAPTGLRQDPTSDRIGVGLRWDDLGPGVTYELARGASADVVVPGTSAVRFLVTPAWVDRTVVSGRGYRYWVRARNAAGPGPWGPPLEVVRPAAAFGEVAWIFADNAARDSVALATNGTVFAFSGDSVLRCLDADGQLRWSFTNALIRFSETPIALPSGGTAVGGHETAHAGGPLHLLDSAGAETALIPNLATGRLPAVESDETLIYPTWDTGLTRRLPDGTIAWTIPSASGWSTPSLWADGTAYLPGSRLISPDGRVLWTSLALGAGIHAAIGRDGTAYLAGGTGEEAGLIAVGTDGSRRWTFPVPGGSIAPPIVLGDDSVVAASTAGEVVRVNADGTLRWRFQTGAPIAASPAAADNNTVWFGTGDGRLMALSGDGIPRTSLALGTRIESAPAIGSDGRIYVSVTGQGVFAVQGDAPPGNAPWPMFRGDAARTGRGTPRSQSPALATGVTAGETAERGAVTVGWNPVPWAESYDVLRGPTPDLASMTELRTELTGATSFADRSAPADVDRYYRVRARNRLGTSEFSSAVVGRQGFRRWTFDTPLTVWGTPAVAADGSLRVALGPHQTVPEAGVTALEGDGRIRWRAGGLPISGPPVIGPGDVTYVAVQGRDLVALSPSGEILWRRTVSSLSAQSIALDGELAVTGDGFVVVPLESGPVVAFDAAGNELWRNTSVVCFRTSAPVVAADGSIACPVAFGATPVLERNGARRFNIALPAQSRPVITAANEWAAVGDNRLVRTTPAGVTNLAFRLPSPVSTAVSLLAEPDGGLLLTVERQGVSAFRPDGTVRWRTTNDLSNPSLPVGALLADGTLLSVEGATMVARDTRDGRTLWQAVGGPTDLTSLTPGPRRALTVLPSGLVIFPGRTNLVAFGPLAASATTGWPLDRRDPARTANLSGPAPVPAAPPNPVASTGTWVDQVKLAWATNGDLATVEIWVSANTNRSDARLLGTTPLGQFAFQHRPAPAGEDQFYWLRATNRAGASTWSGPVRGQASDAATQRAGFRATTNLLTVALGSNRHLHSMENLPTGGRLFAWTETGSLAWSLELESQPLGGPVAAPDGTLHAFTLGQVITVGADGIVRARNALETATIGDAAVDTDGTVFFMDGATLKAIGADGQLRWQSPTTPPIPGRASALDPDGRIVLLGESRFERFQRNGEPTEAWPAGENPPIARFALGPEGDAFFPGIVRTLARLNRAGTEVFSVGIGDGTGLGEPVLGPLGAFGVSTSDGVIAVDPSGTERWRYRAPRATLVALADGGLLITHTNALIALDPVGRERWRYESTAGNFTAPLLLDDGWLAMTAGPELVVLQTEAKPAPGSWSMFRGDPARSARATAAGAAVRITRLQPSATGWALTFVGSPNTRWIVETTVDLRTWQAEPGAAVVALPGETTVEILDSPLVGARFHRLRQAGQ